MDLDTGHASKMTIVIDTFRGVGKSFIKTTDEAVFSAGVPVLTLRRHLSSSAAGRGSSLGIDPDRSKYDATSEQARLRFSSSATPANTRQPFSLNAEERQ